MNRSSQLAATLVTLLVSSACHKKTVLPQPPPPPVPAARTAPRRTRETPLPSTPAPQSSTPNVQTAPPPSTAEPEFRLGQTLTPEEQRAYNAEIDLHLRHATQALGSLGNRALTQQQKTSVAQIRAFITQTQQMRNTDVVRAKSLAERADILTQDLLSTLKK